MQQAGSGLEKIVLSSLRRVPQAEAPLLAWPLVCGSAVAERTRAVQFSDAVLRVEVPDAGWKREMQSLAPRYVAAMNRYAGQKVERIEFVIRPGTTGKPTRMKVTEKDVTYVADLANLELSGDERVAMVRDLNSILDYIDRLNELDTSNVEPMAQVSDRYGIDESKQGSERFAYAYREDVPGGIAQIVDSRCGAGKCTGCGRNILPRAESD